MAILLLCFVNCYIFKIAIKNPFCVVLPIYSTIWLYNYMGMLLKL